MNGVLRRLEIFSVSIDSVLGLFLVFFYSAHTARTTVALHRTDNEMRTGQRFEATR